MFMLFLLETGSGFPEELAPDLGAERRSVLSLGTI
jgi:hypothetical protein